MKNYILSHRVILLVILGILALIPRAGRTPLVHRLLVPIIVGYLVWQKRERLAAICFRPSVWGPVALVVGAALNVLGFCIGGHSVGLPSAVQALFQGGVDPAAASASFLEPLGFVIFVVGLGLVLMGVEAIRELAFPCAFLLFLVPWQDVLGAFFAPWMQHFTATSSCALAAATGLHPHLQGVDIAVPGMVLTVASPCSGLQALMALAAMCALFAYFTKASLAKRWLLFLVGVPMALLMNVVRVWMIMMAGHLWGWKFSMNYVHEYSAPILFLMIVCGLQALKSWMEGKGKKSV